MGQCLVFLLLVTATVTFPVGVAFHQPDPALRAWCRRDDELKRQKIAKRARPAGPGPRSSLPDQERAVPAALGAVCPRTPDRAGASRAGGRVVWYPGLSGAGQRPLWWCPGHQSASPQPEGALSQPQPDAGDLFIRYPGVAQRYPRRGDEPVDVIISSARLWVEVHGRKQLIVAVKYAGETEYRYLVATDLSGRTEDVFRTFTLRWLVEVFIQDWKGHQGWGTLAKQPGVEGSSHGLILSLLVDQGLLLHPAQLARLKNRQPAVTVGSLIESPHPEQQLQHLTETLASYGDLRPSGKHMVGRDLGRMEPTLALKYRAATCAVAS